MFKSCKSALFLLFIALYSFVLTGCFNFEEKKYTYKNIPGVTSEEIAAIEAIKEKTSFFNYGMLPNTETFTGADGEITGFTALLCEWLTELFGIPFIPRHYSWLPLLNGLESGEVDFTGDLTANEERRKTYFMTDTMAQRSIRYFSLKDSPPLSEIAKTRLPRYILQERTTIADDVLQYAGGTFEPVYVYEYDEAYRLLKAGAADVLITEGVQEAFFDKYGDVVTNIFFPMIYSPVSFSTQNPELAPFVSVMQKALENDGIRHLNEMYDLGYQQFLKHKLYLQLTDEEREYLINNPEIPFAAEYDNYPVSFYSSHYKDWQGICFDVLKEVELLTGLEFKIINNNNTEFPELLVMLETGDAFIHSEVIRSAEREGRFLWPNNSFMEERSVLISRVEHRNININRIYSERVGLSKGTAHTEFFYSWFPNHPYTVIYESQEEAFDALIKNKVDLVMNSYSTLLYLTNYKELADYKANYVFDNSFNSTFGINRNQEILCSIIDKALEFIDTRTISEQWRHRTYDYTLRVERERLAFLVVLIVLSLIVLALVAGLFVRSRRAGKEMEKLVSKRTYELALQTATLTTLFDSIPDLIFTKNLKLNFLHCNKAFLEHFNKSIDDLVGKSSEDGLEVTHDEAESFNDSDSIVINEQKTLTVEEHIPHYDGSNPLYETIKMPLMLEEKVIGILGIARDITKRKEMEAAALAASQSKSVFLANMSHEIRTPMNAILGVTELLIQNEELPSGIEEGLNKIYSSCDLLLGIINDILDFSKIEAGKLDIMPLQYKTASLINDSVHLNMMRINSKPIVFDLKIDENVPAKLIGDELRIKQILNNLLSNAFKYTDEGKVTLSVSYDSTSGGSENGSSGAVLVLGVQDTGHGMTPDQLTRLFEEYSRFNQEKKSVVEGTGLGLAITQRLVKLMDGSISVDSESKKGSLFVVRLPQEKVDDEVLGEEVIANLKKFQTNYIIQRKRSQINRDPMPYGKVLIVDDVETNVYVAVGLLKLYRLEIDTAMSGQEAIDKVKAGNKYDIIFMDHMMPEMDGIETTRRIRAWEAEQINETPSNNSNLLNKSMEFPKETPKQSGFVGTQIVALTANAVSGQADIFLKNGFNEFISKPIDIRQLDNALNKFIRDKQPQEVIEAARRQNETAVPEFKIDSLLLESFIRDAQKAIIWLEDQSMQFETDDVLHKFTVIVHGIKSSLWNVGESLLSELAAKMEVSGRNKEIDKIKEFIPGFINDMNELVKRLKLQQQKENESRSHLKEDTKRIHSLLLEIKEMCADYNRKGALDKLAEAGYCSKETKEVLDIIMGNVLHSEFEEAEKAAAVYLSALGAVLDDSAGRGN